jgi:HD-GYP domain-containing protein (c-di-GMP phosphodiesterase class II)
LHQIFEIPSLTASFVKYFTDFHCLVYPASPQRNYILRNGEAAFVVHSFRDQMESDRVIKVPVVELRIGMYVVELDRPWLETPFLVQGFIIRSLQELDTLNELCSYVYVDTGQSKTYHKPAAGRTPTKQALTKARLEEALNVRITPHRDSTAFRDELNVAKGLYSDYEGMVSRFYSDIRLEQKLDMRSVRQSMCAVVDSVIRNPDAFMLLARLRRKSDYTYNHAIGCSVWAAAMGRQLGLPKHVLVNVAAGAMLLDVGKISLSHRLLTKEGAYTDEEKRLMSSHVSHGIELVKQTPGVDNIALEMVLTHHERHNGKGYPKALKGKDIPVYGRMAGIIDCYDALINDRPYRPGMAPSEAIRMLYNVRDVDFQGEMVEAFIQALGVYPAGSLVELTSGEVGVVIAEHRHRRLRPKVMLLLDCDKQPLSERVELDLKGVGEDESGKLIEIACALNPGEYGLNPDDIFL